MKFAVFLSTIAVVAALPTLVPEKRACIVTSEDDGSLTKRCNIPWTKNYGEYEEDIEKRACVITSEDDGSLTKRCNIPWTKNYGEYDD
ncbi:hypothetical protein F1880_001406 [Penicillium rolfsii]|nr:hypothetical protein F1880_001406 [Penicillium rolfsii]